MGARRRTRLALIAGYAAPPKPEWRPEPVWHIEAERPGSLVQLDCFHIGRLSGTKGRVWQYTATDAHSAFLWAETVLDECSRPSFARSLVPKYTALQRDPAEYLELFNFERAHDGRYTKGRTPAEVVHGARKMRPR